MPPAYVPGSPAEDTTPPAGACWRRLWSALGTAFGGLPAGIATQPVVLRSKAPAQVQTTARQVPLPSGLGRAGGPRGGVEGSLGGGPGDIGEAEVVVAGVGPQPGEGLGQVEAGAFGDHAFGLLDHHPAGQRGGQLLVQELGL